MINEPLGLPAGSVRGIIALILTISICVGALLNVPIPDIVYGFLGAIIGFYFGSRSYENNNK